MALASAPAHRMSITFSRTPPWRDVARAEDPWHLIAIAHEGPLQRALGLIGFMACPAELHLVGPRGDRLLELSLWVYGDVARCMRCRYSESLEALHTRLGLEVRR